ncbi:PSD1 and planctomycete cytochrome C domain-containing protein [Bryobacter aggregatus]|uniref:PSD1 and planctomycete cytochrome C domain-containing protein n=1 Tax=Bryobacter aggregatus TaxID=360054 RepID=UPI00056B1890|nr:PSD1 and planctomycete cytochrome C domain-containing protein [Bryobacter aggregatus]
MKAVLTAAIAALIVFASLAQNSSPPADPSPVDFERDVQPILRRNCQGCHGAAQQSGGLRLDAKSAAFSGGISGPSIKPSHAVESLLYTRVIGAGELTRMPMGNKPLPAEQIAILKRWIDEGAKWPDHIGAKVVEVKKHWAFVPPERPATPSVSMPAWPRNPIDNFILAKLDKEQIKPAEEADRITLLRRLSLDLIGLPPTIAEVDAFLKDKSKNAYEKQVDRLLASPHYGERWGRHWLDAARYADSDGYEKDKMRQVWFYRDYVINALNKDLPYDQFVREQIAGDLMPNPTQDQLVATGFLRNSMVNEEGGIDPEQFRMEAMFDRIDAIGKSILGLTIACAQCHNHKFDPLRQEEYYQIFAYLNNTHESNVAVYTPQEQMQRANIFAKIKTAEAELQHRNPDWRNRMHAWEATAKYETPWEVVKPVVDDISTGGQRYIAQSDGSMVGAGYAPTKHRAKLTIQPSTKTIASFRLELLNDPNLPLGGPGRSTLGTSALTEFEVEVARPGQEKPQLLKIAHASADINLPEKELEPVYNDKTTKRRVTGPIEFAYDGKEETSWGHDAGPVLRNLPRNAVFNLATPIDNSDGKTVINVYLSQKAGGWNSDANQNQNLGRMRLSVSADPNAAADMVPQRVREIISIPAASRTPEQEQLVFSYWRSTVPAFRDANAQIDDLWHSLPSGSSQLTMMDRSEMRTTSILERGDFLKPRKQVSPGVPAFLNPLPAGAGGTRLDFAKWLTARNAPTTARSFVNRVWQSYFATGIVETSEDLGKQTAAPSHPELLDWLAVEFMDSGWSIKKLHRLIVTSSTYRQSSKVTPELLSKDPNNRLLARGPRFRVEGEIVRDIALAASGLLNEKIGGPSVFPPAPAFLFLPPASYGPKNWFEEKDAQRYRRALYTFRYRSVPYPALMTFDTPNGDVSCVRRTRSNTPLQALTALNEPLFLETAKALADKTLKEGGTTEDSRIVFAFRRTLSRPPQAAELAELKSFLNKQLDRKLPAEQAWMALARVILNLDETITKE